MYMTPQQKLEEKKSVGRELMTYQVKSHTLNYLTVTKKRERENGDMVIHAGTTEARVGMTFLHCMCGLTAGSHSCHNQLSQASSKQLTHSFYQLHFLIVCFICIRK